MIAMELFVIPVGGALCPDKVGVGSRTDAVAGMETGDRPQSVGA